jgi:hypothetical protein
MSQMWAEPYKGILNEIYVYIYTYIHTHTHLCMYDIPMINLILPSRKLAYTLNIFLFDYVVSTQNG